MKKFKLLIKDKSPEELKYVFEQSSSVSEFCRDIRGWGVNKVPSIALKYAREIAIIVGFDIEDYHAKRREYSNSPIKCRYCEKNLTWDDFKAGKVFCNSSCSASYSNTKREKRSDHSKSLTSDALKTYWIEKGIEYDERYCAVCGKYIGVFTKSSNRKLCTLCNPKNKVTAVFEKWKNGTASLEELSSKGKITKGELNGSLANRIKIFQLEEQKHECKICGISDQWFGKTLVFVLDHIDGDWSNHTRSNLRLICSNCNSLLDTTKHKKSGTGRYSGREYYRRISETD